MEKMKGGASGKSVNRTHYEWPASDRRNSLQRFTAVRGFLENVNKLSMFSKSKAATGKKQGIPDARAYPIYAFPNTWLGVRRFCLEISGRPVLVNVPIERIRSYFCAWGIENTQRFF